MLFVKFSLSARAMVISGGVNIYIDFVSLSPDFEFMLRLGIEVSDYHRYRFHSDIISRAVWLYYRFNLSFRDVEELIKPCIDVSYKTRRLW